MRFSSPIFLLKNNLTFIFYFKEAHRQVSMQKSAKSAPILQMNTNQSDRQKRRKSFEAYMKACFS